MFNDINFNKAKAHEANNQWFEAAQLWRTMGRNDDFNACMLLHNAVSAGDTYRNRVANELGTEPDKAENPHKWVKWYDGMTKIYNEVFKK